jgi:hypothetical protein
MKKYTMSTITEKRNIKTMVCDVARYRNNILEQPGASIFSTEDRASRFSQNVGTYVANSTTYQKTSVSILTA